MTFGRWPAPFAGLLVGRASRRAPAFHRLAVEVELVLPPGAEVLDVVPTADGRGVVVTYEDGPTEG